jgi:diphthine synthase
VFECPSKLIFLSPDFSEDTLCVGVARVGTDKQAVCHAPLRTMITSDMGEPLQSMVIAGKLHPLEEKMLSVVSSSWTTKS